MILSFLLALLSISPDTTTVEITFISQKEGGLINIALYDLKNDFMEEEALSQSWPFKKDSLIVKITVPNKPFAITSFHDLDGNQQLNTNWMGIPIEPYGFSNNARGMMGPPDFEDCLINPTEIKKTIIYLK